MVYLSIIEKNNLQKQEYIFNGESERTQLGLFNQ
jgi:hypothetical protein